MRDSGRRERPAAASPTVVGSGLAVALAVVVLLLVLWAAVVGPDRLIEGGAGAHGDLPIPLRRPATVTRSPSGTDGAGAPWRSVLWLLGIALAAAWTVVAGLILRWWWRALRQRRSRREAPPRRTAEELDLEPLSAPAARSVAAAAAHHQWDDLASGTPRNAIVACWHRFEEAGRAAGIAPRPWETSAEYTLRILDRADPDSRALAELAELFREARFSEHDLGEESRVRAQDALGRLHARLGLAVGSRS